MGKGRLADLSFEVEGLQFLFKTTNEPFQVQLIILMLIK